MDVRKHRKIAKTHANVEMSAMFREFSIWGWAHRITGPASSDFASSQLPVSIDLSGLPPLFHLVSTGAVNVSFIWLLQKFEDSTVSISLSN